MWSRDGTPLNLGPVASSAPIQPLLRSSYNISRALPEDAGSYSCTALANNESVMHEARIDVYGPPYIRSLGPIKILSGTTATIHCPYYGYPISKVKWERSDLQPIHYERYKRSNGIALADTKIKRPNNFKKFNSKPKPFEVTKRNRRSFTADEDGKLVITNVDNSENGAMYTCTVTSPTGEMARRSFEIQVLEPPLLDELNFGTNIQEGQIAKVICSLKSGDTPIFFNWLKDGVPISGALKVDERTQDILSMLIIKKVGLQHCGTYTCIASNHAARVNVSAELFIKVAPKWLEEPQNTSMVLGRQGHVGCSASGYPQPQVHWMKKDEVSGAWRSVLEQRGSVLQSLPNGSLVLDLVTAADEGIYSCRAENGVGQPLQKDILISVNRPVTFESSVSNVTTKVGHAATIMCEVFGDHPIRIFWTHNSRALELTSERMKVTSHQTQKGATSEILLSSTDPGDSGVWLCKASNTFGAAQHSTFLTVQEPPGPPVEVSVEAVRGRTVRIGWRAPPLPPALYMLQYAPHHHLHWDSATTINVTSIPSQIRQFTEVTGLRPATPYTARICSVGVAGLSAYTRPLLFTTIEEAPSSAPLSVQVESGPGPGELRVSWLPPPTHTHNGLLLGYIIRAVPQITLHTEEKARVLKMETNMKQAIIPNLTKGGRYSVTVSCYNSAGAGPSSPAAYRDTPEGVPEEAPEDLQCSAVSSSSMRISWRPLPLHLQGGAMTGYTLFYSSMDGKQNNVTSVHGSVQLDGLQKYSNYSIWVSGHCRLGMGPTSRPILCSTMEDIPTAPADVKALVSTSSSVVVSWLPPLYPNGRITHYTVYVRLAYGGGTMQSYRVAEQWPVGDDKQQDSLSHAVRGLEQGRRYEAWVTAATLVGEGEPSKTVSAEPSDRVVAGISSLGVSLVVVAGKALKLACRALGSPQPRTVWYHDSKVITHHPSFILNPDDSLHINNMNPTLEGNYTCVAKNLFGWDSVSYLVAVVAPPTPPRLKALPERQALLLEWAPPNHTSPILGYTLSWRTEFDVWQVEEIAGGSAGTKRINSLGCGKLYEVKLVAQGTIGTSSPAVAVATTLGTVMTAPIGSDWIWSNSTHLSLQLDSWTDGECGASRWSVDYRPLSTRLWLQPDPLPVENGHFLIIGGLKPARWYQIRVTATNQAGATAAIYTVATKTEFGEMIGPPSDPMDTSILVMVCSCVLLLLCMLVCVFVAIQKHRHRVMCGSSADSVYKERGCAPLAARPLPTPDCPPLPARLYTSPTANRKASSTNSEMFEISPYAQFSMGFQTFGHVDNQDRPAYVKAKQGVFSTETRFQMGSDSEDSDSISKPTPLSNTQNKTCRVQYHR